MGRPSLLLAHRDSSATVRVIRCRSRDTHRPLHVAITVDRYQPVIVYRTTILIADDDVWIIILLLHEIDLIILG